MNSWKINETKTTTTKCKQFYVDKKSISSFKFIKYDSHLWCKIICKIRHPIKSFREYDEYDSYVKMNFPGCTSFLLSFVFCERMCACLYYIFFISWLCKWGTIYANRKQLTVLTYMNNTYMRTYLIHYNQNHLFSYSEVFRNFMPVMLVMGSNWWLTVKWKYFLW